MNLSDLTKKQYKVLSSVERIWYLKNPKKEFEKLREKYQKQIDFLIKHDLICTCANGYKITSKGAMIASEKMLFDFQNYTNGKTFNFKK